MPNIAAYIYKPKGKSKYPARVYLFLNWEHWNQRNLYPMGLSKASPFLVRDMTEWEIDFVKDSHRLIYLQYENWNLLLSDDESMDLDKKHMDLMKEHQQKYPLSDTRINQLYGVP